MKKKEAQRRQLEEKKRTEKSDKMSKQMDEEAMIARANEERAKLFQRYDRGREAGAEIDSWEDPAFEIYHQTDRYGFIHDKRLPRKIDPNEAKAKAIEMERVKKWLKMTSKWEDQKTIDVLHRRIYKGIPDKVRPRVSFSFDNTFKNLIEINNNYSHFILIILGLDKIIEY